LNYWFSKSVHKAIFEPRSPLFGIVKKFSRRLDHSQFWEKVINSGETLMKTALYGCQHCGDCALFDVAYLCPVSQCPKNQRNGPCGGSYRGWCEVYPEERKCIWVRAYYRLGSHGFLDHIRQGIVPPCDWALWETSSWLNYFNGRDHIGKKLFKAPLISNKQDSGPED
jgi:methylenetetrahydrofolate reductase (NADPH)